MNNNAKKMTKEEEVALQGYALYCMVDALKAIGIEVDPEKNVIDEINEKWNSLNDEQQQAVAVAFTKAVM